LVEPKRIAKTPRERFMQAAEVELTKFVRKEIAFQQADRNERAMKLCLPIEGRQVAGENRLHSSWGIARGMARKRRLSRRLAGCRRLERRI
jgi:hypothetical protein